MLVDTHAHIQFAKYKEDAEAVMQRALDSGMTVINVGSQIDTSKQAVEMLSKYPEHVYAAVGLHPVHTWKHNFTDVDEIQDDFFTREESFNYEAYKQLAEHPKVVGIGECGLDYYRLPNSDTKDTNAHTNDANNTADKSARYREDNENNVEIKRRQKEAFLEQIRLAQELDKTLIIHCRPSSGTTDAYDDILSILLKIKDEGLRIPRFEVHCFTGPLSIAQKFIELGGYIGLNGIITFDKTGVSEEVVKNIPLESIVLETDSPYLTPAPHRGKRNEPVFVELVAKKIAEWKGVSFDEVANTTAANAKKLFNI